MRTRAPSRLEDGNEAALGGADERRPRRRRLPRGQWSSPAACTRWLRPATGSWRFARAIAPDFSSVRLERRYELFFLIFNDPYELYALATPRTLVRGAVRLARRPDKAAL